MNETPATRPPTTDPRTLAIWRLGRKLTDGTAGLDRHDAAVMVIEGDTPDSFAWVDLIGELLITHPFTRRDGDHCIRARAIIESDVRMLLKLDDPGAPTISDEPLASQRTVPLALAPPLATAGYAESGDWRSRQ